MQKIESWQRLEDKAAIPVLGYEVFLISIKELSGDVGEGELGITKFADNAYPTMFTFGYGTRDPHTGEYSECMITSLSDIAKTIFGMSDEDATIHEDYILNIAQQLGLYIVPVENGVVVTHSLLQNIANSGDITWEDVLQQSESNRDIKVAISGMGAATTLGKAIEIGINRYNKVHMNDKIEEIANIIKGIRFINDAGDESTLTLTGVDNILTKVKDVLTVSRV